jgi:hypothetical protein
LWHSDQATAHMPVQISPHSNLTIFQMQNGVVDFWTDLSR